MKKVLILIFCALILLLPGCSSLSSTAAPIAEPMGRHIAQKYPYNPEDPDHDYRADGLYLEEEVLQWGEEQWQEYLEKYPEDYHLYLYYRYGIDPNGGVDTVGEDHPYEKETIMLGVETPTQGTTQNCD